MIRAISLSMILLVFLTQGVSGQDENMSFFITSDNPGSGADLGGLAGADAFPDRRRPRPAFDSQEAGALFPQPSINQLLRATAGVGTHYLLSLRTTTAGGWVGSALQCRAVWHQGRLNETELNGQ